MKLWTAMRRIGLALALAIAVSAPAAQQVFAECVTGSGTICPK